MVEDQANFQIEVIDKNFINVEDLIRSKNPALLKMLPRFLIKYLKRIIHQNEINETLYKYRNVYGLDFVDVILRDFNIKLDIVGLENIPAEGGCIFVANHPLGGMDGMAFFQAIAKVRKDLVFPVNDLLMGLPNLRPLYVPINKHGLNTRNIEIIDKTFSSDKGVLYFPAGLCSRKKRGKIVDLEWKKTFISKAKKYKHDVIPTYINGKNSNFFYNLANVRKFLGIKANIEMLYLVNELYKQKNKTIRIIFGKAIPYSSFNDTLKDVQWAQKVKQIVYNLGKETG